MIGRKKDLFQSTNAAAATVCDHPVSERAAASDSETVIALTPRDPAARLNHPASLPETQPGAGGLPAPIASALLPGERPDGADATLCGGEHGG
jgi:hypothetical protein